MEPNTPPSRWTMKIKNGHLGQMRIQEFCRKSFGKHVNKLMLGVNWQQFDNTIIYFVMYKMKINFSMFYMLMKSWIRSNMNSSLDYHRTRELIKRNQLVKPLAIVGSTQVF